MTPYAVLAAGFALLLAAGACLHLLARVGAGGVRPLGDALHAALARPPGRWVVLAVWLWVGIHFLAR